MEKNKVEKYHEVEGYELPPKIDEVDDKMYNYKIYADEKKLEIRISVKGTEYNFTTISRADYIKQLIKILIKDPKLMDSAKAELEKPLGPEYPDGYLFITMGAGDNWKLGKEILK